MEERIFIPFLSPLNTFSPLTQCIVVRSNNSKGETQTSWLAHYSGVNFRADLILVIKYVFIDFRKNGREKGRK